MRLTHFLAILVLSLSSSLAVAKGNHRNCADLDNDRARHECREHKYKNVDCGNLDNEALRKACREKKSD